MLTVRPLEGVGFVLRGYNNQSNYQLPTTNYQLPITNY